ncbi:MAG: hypothetical protein ACRYFU_06270 [Janthinobacterium lividum]
MKTYVYKLTSDRGGAPCAPPPCDGQIPLLTLSICKPAIRRTAGVGDRLLGITSRALAQREGYPLHAVIYAARVTGTLDFGSYYEPEGAYRQRPDCIYQLDPEDGTLRHTGATRLHAEPAYLARDVGREPHFRNARTLLCEEFRYFGAEAVVIPARFPLLLHMAEAIGQGHRVYDQRSAESHELDRLFTTLWKRSTRYTPERVEEEAPGHAPRP